MRPTGAAQVSLSDDDVRQIEEIMADIAGRVDVFRPFRWGDGSLGLDGDALIRDPERAALYALRLWATRRVNSTD